MKLKKENGLYFIVAQEGEEIMSSLNEICEQERINSAVILSGIGMLKDIEIGYFNGTEYNMRKETTAHELISFSGNISRFSENSERIIHAHVSLASSTNSMIGGHLFKGTVMVTAEIAVMELPFEMQRKKVSESLKLLSF